MNLLNIDCCVFFVEVIGVFGLFCMCIIFDVWSFKFVNKYWWFLKV